MEDAAFLPLMDWPLSFSISEAGVKMDLYLLSSVIFLAHVICKEVEVISTCVTLHTV